MQKTARSLESNVDYDDEEESDTATTSNDNNNRHSYNLLSSCYVSAVLLSTLHLFFQLILHQPCEVCMSTISIL